MKLILLIIGLMWLTGISSATTYYIDTDGSGDYDCDGTNDEVQFQWAIDNATDGDSIQINDSNYYFVPDIFVIYNIDNLTLQGNTSNRSAVKIYQASGTDAILINVSTLTNITMQYFEMYDLAGSSDKGIFVEHCDNSSFLYINATGNDGHPEGICFSDVDYSIVDSYNGDRAGFGSFAEAGYRSDYNIIRNSVVGSPYLSISYSFNTRNLGWLVENNTANQAGTIGFDYYGGSQDATYRNNTINNCKWGFRILGGSNSVWEDNTINVWHTAFILYDQYAVNNTTIRNNIIDLDPGAYGIWSETNTAADSETVYIENNVFYGGAYGILNAIDPNRIYLLKNNIFMSQTISAVNDSQGSTTSTYDLFYNNTENYGGTILDKTGDIIGSNPLFYDVSINDFHLNSTNGTWNGTGWENMISTSPGVDGGNPADDYSNEPSPNGSRINIGAYGGSDEASKSPGAPATSTITIPANSLGMFNNWTAATNFSNIAANESNDICYSYYNVTVGEWESHYPPYSWNADYDIPVEASVFGFFGAQTDITSEIKTPVNTNLSTGWNLIFLMGTDNETIADIKADIGTNCTAVWGFNSTAGAYTNTSSYTIQPCEGFLTYLTQNMTPWVRSDL